MTLTKRDAHGLSRTRSLLGRLIELPDLARTIQSLPPEGFAALVRKIGVEDAGEIVPFATTEQLVQAFDEDLFVSDRAGERETLDVGRFAVWLEVLLEAGDEVAAARVAELDEDFVALALSGIVLVVELDALRERLVESDEDEARKVEKSLESALTEEIDGYMLVAKQHDGWDAALALILALDRDHRALLVRLLERLARLGSRCLDDLDELSTVLTEGESLAEDVEAAREERRGQRGYVEPQAARAFLTLARKPLARGDRDRDPLTRAYFREVDRSRHVARPGAALAARDAPRALPADLQREIDEASGVVAEIAPADARARPTAMHAFTEALRALSARDPALFGERMEELAYLTNVLVAGHERGGARLRPKEAADAVLATVCFGAIGELRDRRRNRSERATTPDASDLVEVLTERPMDILFRIGSSELARGGAPGVKGAKTSGLLHCAEELEAALAPTRS